MSPASLRKLAGPQKSCPQGNKKIVSSVLITHSSLYNALCLLLVPHKNPHLHTSYCHFCKACSSSFYCFVTPGTIAWAGQKLTGIQINHCMSVFFSIKTTLLLSNQLQLSKNGRKHSYWLQHLIFKTSVSVLWCLKNTCGCNRRFLNCFISFRVSMLIFPCMLVTCLLSVSLYY